MKRLRLNGRGEWERINEPDFMPSISLFIPVHNEEKTIRKNIERIKKSLENTKLPYEIIVVDDGSTDNTQKEIGKSNTSIVYVYFSRASRRENLANSFKFARGEIIIFTDADLSVNPNNLKRLVMEIMGGKDIAIGSRNMGIKAKRGIFRQTTSWIYNKTVALLFNSKIKDHQCGFKAFRKNAVSYLVEKIGYDSTHQRGWFWDAEMLIEAQKTGYKIEEFPVAWKEGAKSEFNFFREIKLIPYLLKKVIS